MEYQNCYGMSPDIPLEAYWCLATKMWETFPLWKIKRQMARLTTLKNESQTVRNNPLRTSNPMLNPSNHLAPRD